MAIFVGRTARLFKDTVVIAYGKNISVKMTAEAVKDYSMDAAAPAVLGSGKQWYTFSIERLYVDEAYLTLLLAGTTFTINFAPAGTTGTLPGVEMTLCIVTSAEHTAGESAGVLEKVSGEAKTCALETA